jgi:uncharacterized protein YeaO (DUF488 family)
LVDRAVNVRRIYESTGRYDGYRVLVDRLWPRGIAKEKAHLDEWCKEAAPSTSLRKWYGHDPERFHEFRHRYRAELRSGEGAAAVKHLGELATRHRLTLVTATKELKISGAAVLAEFLNGPATRKSHRAVS